MFLPILSLYMVSRVCDPLICLPFRCPLALPPRHARSEPSRRQSWPRDTHHPRRHPCLPDPSLATTQGSRSSPTSPTPFRLRRPAPPRSHLQVDRPLTAVVSGTESSSQLSTSAASSRQTRGATSGESVGPIFINTYAIVAVKTHVPMTLDLQTLN